MVEKFDYLNWWNKLEEIWQEMFKLDILEKIDILHIKKKVGKELTDGELVLLKFKENFDKNNQEIKVKDLTHRKKYLNCGTVEISEPIRLVQGMKWIIYGCEVGERG